MLKQSRLIYREIKKNAILISFPSRFVHCDTSNFKMTFGVAETQHENPPEVLIQYLLELRTSEPGGRKDESPPTAFATSHLFLISSSRRLSQSLLLTQFIHNVMCCNGVPVSFCPVTYFKAS